MLCLVSEIAAISGVRDGHRNRKNRCDFGALSLLPTFWKWGSRTRILGFGGPSLLSGPQWVRCWYFLFVGAKNAQNRSENGVNFGDFRRQNQHIVPKNGLSKNGQTLFLGLRPSSFLCFWVAHLDCAKINVFLKIDRISLKPQKTWCQNGEAENAIFWNGGSETCHLRSKNTRRIDWIILPSHFLKTCPFLFLIIAFCGAMFLMVLFKFYVPLGCVLLYFGCLCFWLSLIILFFFILVFFFFFLCCHSSLRGSIYYCYCYLSYPPPAYVPPLVFLSLNQLCYSSCFFGLVVFSVCVLHSYVFLFVLCFGGSDLFFCFFDSLRHLGILFSSRICPHAASSTSFLFFWEPSWGLFGHGYKRGQYIFGLFLLSGCLGSTRDPPQEEGVFSYLDGSRRCILGANLTAIFISCRGIRNKNRGFRSKRVVNESDPPLFTLWFV